MMGCPIYIFIILLSGRAAASTDQLPEATVLDSKSFNTSTSADYTEGSVRNTRSVNFRSMGGDGITSAANPIDPAVHRETENSSEDPGNPILRSVVERAVEGNEIENSNNGTSLWDIFLHPWSKLGRNTRDVNAGTAGGSMSTTSEKPVEADLSSIDDTNKEKETLSSEIPPILLMPGGNVFSVERQTGDSKEDLEGAEQRIGGGFFYWYPQPSYGPRFWPPYRRRFFNRYMRYPMYFGG